MMYLKKLYLHHQPTFLLVVFLLAGQAFFTYLGIETFPFLHWGMYSKIEPAKDRYTGFEVLVDGQVFDYTSMTDIEQQLLISPLSRYHLMKESDWQDPLSDVIERKYRDRTTSAQYEYLKSALLNRKPQMDAFPAWFKKRTERAVGYLPNKVTVKVVTYEYDSTGRPSGLLHQELFTE